MWSMVSVCPVTESGGSSRRNLAQRACTWICAWRRWSGKCLRGPGAWQIMHWLGSSAVLRGLFAWLIRQVHAGQCSTPTIPPTFSGLPCPVPLFSVVRYRSCCSHGSGTVHASPWLHEEVAQRMLQRLDVIRLQLSNGCIGSRAGVRKPMRRCCCIKPVSPSLADARFIGACALQHRYAFWANMVLDKAIDPAGRKPAQWRRLLSPDGFADVLLQRWVRAAFQSCVRPYLASGMAPPVAAFTDIHD